MTPNERTELTRLIDVVNEVAKTSWGASADLASTLARLCREIAYREKATLRGDWMGQALRFESLARRD